MSFKKTRNVKKEPKEEAPAEDTLSVETEAAEPAGLEANVQAQLERIREHLGFLEKKLDTLLQLQQQQQTQQHQQQSGNRPPFRNDRNDFRHERRPFKSYNRAPYGHDASRQGNQGHHHDRHDRHGNRSGGGNYYQKKNNHHHH